MKAVLTVLASVVAFSATAQQMKLKSQTAFPVYPKMERTYNVKTGAFSDLNGHVGQQVSKMGATDLDVIGSTTYDLQSNGSIPRRLFRAADGTMLATWTMSADRNGLYTDRGTGYNFFNGVEWRAEPPTRIEFMQATGWGQALILPDGSELVIAHNSDEPDRLHKSTREVAGVGVWQEENLPELDPSVLWPRMALGGTDGNSIHIIARTESSDDGLNSPVYSGLEGALYYSRSEDGGETWEVNNFQLPGMDTTNYVGISGDSYSIAAKGRFVAIVYAGLMEGVVLWKSEDNGKTWDMKVVLPQLIPKFQESVHNTAEMFGPDQEVYTADGSCEVVIDEDGLAHVFYGVQFIANDVVGDDLLQFNPGANAIDYWNENQEGQLASTVAASIADPAAFEGMSSDAFAIYGFAGFASMPTASIGADGCIYMAYAAMTTSNDFFQFYRHTFAVRSCDGGASWSFPIDITATETNRECVFGAAASTTDEKFHMIYQRDLVPGLSVSGDNDPIGPNDIVYSATDIADFGDPVICQPIIDGYEALCGDDDSLVLSISGVDQLLWSTGETTASIVVSDPGTYGVTVTTPCGDLIQQELPVDQAGDFTLDIVTNQLPECDSASGILALELVGPEMDYTYLWSNGSSDTLISNLGPAIYAVQAFDTLGCGKVSTIALNEIGAPVIDTIIVANESCDGVLDGTILAKVSGSGPLDFDWGDALAADSQLVNLDGGFYELVVTDTSGCSATEFALVEDGIAFSTFVESTNETCNGAEGMIDLSTVTESSQAFGYSWSNGATTQDLNGLSAQTYYVTVTDANGCTQIDSAAVGTYTAMQIDADIDDQATIGSILLTVTGGSDPVTYLWNNGSKSKNLFTDQKGTYIVIATDAGGCTAQANYTLNGNVGVADRAMARLELFPNPVVNQLNFSGISTESAEVVITNQLGQMVRELQWTSESLDVSGLENGVYLISVQTSDQRVTGSFVIQR